MFDVLSCVVLPTQLHLSHTQNMEQLKMTKYYKELQTYVCISKFAERVHHA